MVNSNVSVRIISCVGVRYKVQIFLISGVYDKKKTYCMQIHYKNTVPITPGGALAPGGAEAPGVGAELGG